MRNTIDKALPNKMPSIFLNQAIFYYLSKMNISPLHYASKDLQTLLELKKMAQLTGDNLLLAKCEEIELEKFPISQEEINANKDAEKLILVFQMAGLRIDKPTCYRITKTLELHKKKKGKFDSIDGSKILNDSKIFFLRK